MLETEDWKKYKSVGPKVDKSIAARIGATPFELEVTVAKRKKIYAPEAGLPDKEAIKRILGLTVDGVYDAPADPNKFNPGCSRISPAPFADGFESGDSKHYGL